MVGGLTNPSAKHNMLSATQGRMRVRIEKWIAVFEKNPDDSKDVIAYVPDKETADFVISAYGTSGGFSTTSVLVQERENCGHVLSMGAVYLSTKKDIEDRIRKQAIAKLNPAEKNALGIS